MARRDYGFVRSFGSIGSDPTQFRNLLAHGYSGALINYDDPLLEQAVAAAQQAGVPFGFWGDPNAVGDDNAAYVARMKALQRYNPSLYALDLENSYKGDPGSANWNKMAELARMWQAAMPGARTAITPLGSPHSMYNWNVGAWGPKTEWMPQAYGANPNTDIFGAQSIVDSLVRAGVSRDMISPILGPGHFANGQGGYEGSALWTIDDFAPYGQLPFPKASGQGSTAPQTGGSTQVTGTTTRPRSPGLSQSQQQVAARGLQWGGKLFGSPEQFINQYLKPRNLDYQNWAKNHPLAAQGLSTRSRTR